MGDKKKKTKKDDEVINLLKKVQADFENYQKRVEKEQKTFVEFACQEMVENLLPVLDSFELALKNTDNKDIEAIYNQLWNILSQKGVSKIDALGKKFDPFFHEALMQEESDEESGIVIEELQSGYMISDKVIRMTKVKVAK